MGPPAAFILVWNSCRTAIIALSCLLELPLWYPQCREGLLGASAWESPCAEPSLYLTCAVASISSCSLTLRAISIVLCVPSPLPLQEFRLVWDVIFNPEQIFGPEVRQEEGEYLEVQPDFLKLPTGKEGDYLSPVPCPSFSPRRSAESTKIKIQAGLEPWKSPSEVACSPERGLAGPWAHLRFLLCSGATPVLALVTAPGVPALSPEVQGKPG